MPAGLLPSVVRIGTEVGVILLRAAKPHIRRGIEFGASEIAGELVTRGIKKFQRGKAKGRQFIMKRGNRRFQCSEVRK